MKLTPKEIITTLIGWTFVQGVLLLGSLLLWNWVMPSINIPKINFLQITILYCLYKLFCFDWIKQYNDQNLNSKSDKNNETR